MPKLEMCKTYKLSKRKFCVCVLNLTENSNFLKAERGETSKVFFFFKSNEGTLLVKTYNLIHPLLFETHSVIDEIKNNKK